MGGLPAPCHVWAWASAGPMSRFKTLMQLWSLLMSMISDITKDRVDIAVQCRAQTSDCNTRENWYFSSLAKMLWKENPTPHIGITTELILFVGEG